MESEDGERDEDAERADRFDVNAVARDPPHNLRADPVQNRRKHDDRARDRKNGHVVRGIEMRSEADVRERRDIAHGAGIDRRDRREQREAVDPADEPAVPRADAVLPVLIECSGERILAGKLAEDERDEHHTSDDDGYRPNVAWAAGAEPERVERVDAHHRAEVAEGYRKIIEE